MVHAGAQAMPLTALLAHGTGADEALLVMAPVAIFAALLTIANRRAQAMPRDHSAEPDPVEDAEPTNDS